MRIKKGNSFMKKYISVLLAAILIFSCFGIFAGCSEKARVLELDVNFEEYETGAVLYDAAKSGTQTFAAYSSKGKLYNGEDYTAANITVTDSNAYMGVKSMQHNVYSQYVTTPLKLLPNTKYTLSFFFYCPMVGKTSS